MHAFLKWVLVISLVAGVTARGMSLERMHVVPCDHSHCHGSDHHHPCESGEEHDENGDCPADHHHHSCCQAQAQPLILEKVHDRRLEISSFLRLGIVRESEIAPEEPILSSEKPPLI